MKINMMNVYALISFYMLGVIWLIQLIHYPAFLSIEPNKFLDFHAHHTEMMGYIAGPAMILELILSIYFFNHNTFMKWNLALVLLLWGLTFFVSVPIHQSLANGYNTDLINRLIITNWPRTILWTSKALLVFSVTIYKPQDF